MSPLFNSLLVLTILSSTQAEKSCSIAQYMKTNSTIVNLDSQGCTTFFSEPCNKTEKVTKLVLTNNKIKSITSSMFTCLRNLKKLHLEHNSVTKIQSDSFSGLSQLSQLYLDNNSVTEIAEKAFDNCSLTTLHLANNKLTELPVFGPDAELTTLDIAYNPITRLDAATLEMYKSIESLYLGGTKITELHDSIFSKNKELRTLSLKESNLRIIHERALEGTQLVTLDLQSTKISHLPGNNLEKLESLYIKGATKLYEIPVVSFKRLKNARVEYPFHCCLIKTKPHHSAEVATQPPPPVGATVQTISCPNTSTPLTTSNTSSVTTKSRTSSSPPNQAVIGLPFDYCNNLSSLEFVTLPPPIQDVDCLPREDAFNPCGDLLDSNELRVCSWIVMVFAVLGNSIKFFVLLMSKRKISITRVLMCNLAFANLSMGVFLCMLVSADLYSLGEYQNFAYQWQYRAGCQVAGFLSIFSTELTVFVLTVITVERYFTIVHPLQVQKHLSIKQIVVLVVIGWGFSLTIAALPVLQIGVSSYEKVAICLPFEVESTLSKVYVTFILATNGLAFFFVLFCYSRMYCSLGHSGTGDSSHRVETRVAKRMAMLVITNFACWFPIALVGLIAIYDTTLIGVPAAQFFLVFVYPINSFTNPYFYAMGTKHFQLDALEIIGRLGMCDCAIKNLRDRLQDHLDLGPNSSRGFTGSRISLSSMRSGHQTSAMSGRNNNSSCNSRGSSKSSKSYNGFKQTTLNGHETESTANSPICSSCGLLSMGSCHRAERAWKRQRRESYSVNDSWSHQNDSSDNVRFSWRSNDFAPTLSPERQELVEGNELSVDDRRRPRGALRDEPFESESDDIATTFTEEEKGKEHSPMLGIVPTVVVTTC